MNVVTTPGPVLGTTVDFGGKCYPAANCAEYADFQERWATEDRARLVASFDEAGIPPESRLAALRDLDFDVRGYTYPVRAAQEYARAVQVVKRLVGESAPELQWHPMNVVGLAVTLLGGGEWWEEITSAMSKEGGAEGKSEQ